MDKRNEPSQADSPDPRRPPDSFDTESTSDSRRRADGSESDPHASDSEPFPGENPEDDVLPISPGRRRLAMYIGVLFILVIVAFLFFFGATHTEQSENGSMFGRIHSALAMGTVA